MIKSFRRLCGCPVYNVNKEARRPEPVVQSGMLKHVLAKPSHESQAIHLIDTPSDAATYPSLPGVLFFPQELVQKTFQDLAQEFAHEYNIPLFTAHMQNFKPTNEQMADLNRLNEVTCEAFIKIVRHKGYSVTMAADSTGNYVGGYKDPYYTGCGAQNDKDLKDIFTQLASKKNMNAMRKELGLRVK